jgi:hypothetical protein
LIGFKARQVGKFRAESIQRSGAAKRRQKRRVFKRDPLVAVFWRINMPVQYFSKLTNAQLDVYYSKHQAAIPLPFSGIKNKNYKVIGSLGSPHNSQAGQEEQVLANPSGHIPQGTSKIPDNT